MSRRSSNVNTELARLPPRPHVAPDLRLSAYRLYYVTISLSDTVITSVCKIGFINISYDAVKLCPMYSTNQCKNNAELNRTR